MEVMGQNIYISPNNYILIILSFLWINSVAISFKFNLSTFSLHALGIINDLVV